MAQLTDIAGRKIAWGVAAALALTVIFLLLDPMGVGGQIPDAIDLTAPVEANNCVPCHTQLGETTNPGLVFSHGNHLMVSCTACHYRAVHEGGDTFTPPMESCFNCHGVPHGPAGELATAECEDCHTPSFDLRPSWHTNDWVEQPHADRAKADPNHCAMCHDAPVDCDQCHEDEGIDVGPMPDVYMGILPDQLERPAITVYPNEPTSMGQCVHCHPDLDDFSGERVIFAHADHLRRNYDCDVCHPDFGHGIESIRRPDMLSCYRCHGLTHAAAGEVATEDCLACHPSDFELKPPDHTPEFEAGEHKERATDEPEYCAMCHTPEFCVECHQGRRDSGPGSELVIPADHTSADWLSAHGGLYLAQTGSCGSCHDSASCKRCHKTVMPHPPNWLEDHAPAGDADREDCNVCHTDRDSCQNCHHNEVKRAELLEKNCTPCHDEMSAKPATEIQHKGYAEHAVHFEVPKVKGKPYKCYDCHVSFGASEEAQALAEAQGHDLRLCYECHGSLDVFEVEIAPYPGKSLCVRCHTDLGI